MSPEATLRDVPRAWVALDVDGLPAPPGANARNLHDAASVIRAALPPEMRGASMIIQASASAGIKPGIRARAWFLLSRPWLGGDLAAWLGGIVPGLDHSTLHPSQIHYTARPMFQPGIADPLPDRLLVQDGPRATPPPLTSSGGPVLQKAVTSGAASKPDAFSHMGSPTSRFAALLRGVRGAREGNRHNQLWWAACRAGEMIAARDLSESVARAALIRAAVEAGLGQDDAERTARDGIQCGEMEAQPSHG